MMKATVLTVAVGCTIDADQEAIIEPGEEANRQVPNFEARPRLTRPDQFSGSMTQNADMKARVLGAANQLSETFRLERPMNFFRYSVDSRRRDVYSASLASRSARTLILLAAIAGVAQGQFDASFQSRAMAHIRYLAGLGNRIAGSEGDSKAIRYVQEQFERLGLPVSVEPFVFRSFNLEKAVVSADDQNAEVERIVFDPYVGIARLRGAVAFIVPEDVDEWAVFSKLDLKDKLVVTRGRANAYRLASKAPQAVVFVSGPDFERLRATNPTTALVEIKGKETKVRSANVVATLSPQDSADHEVILSAHHDSVRVPGADDNASGVAVLLELARYYRSLEGRLPFRLKFVALGAEEVGMLGAKAYLGTHLGELKDCSLVFNMDSIGGNDKMYVEMQDGVRGIAGKAVNQLTQDLMDKALVDVDAKWMYIPSGVASSSNVPEWLQTALKLTAKDLGFEFVPSRDMGSDHTVFAQAGIVATDIAISGAKIHSPEDVPEQISPTSLERAARLVVGVIAKVPASVASAPARAAGLPWPHTRSLSPSSASTSMLSCTSPSAAYGTYRTPRM